MTSFYSSGLEHVSDELCLLDLLIKRRVHKLREQYQNDLKDRIPGLYISDEEIDQILSRPFINGYSKKSNLRKENHLDKSIELLSQKIIDRVEKSERNGVILPLQKVSKLFNLSQLEVRMIIVCLATELDNKYQKLFAYLQDDMKQKIPSIDLVLKLLCNGFKERIEARSCFLNQSPLMRNHILQFFEDPISQNEPFISKFIKLDDRMVNFIIGMNEPDPKISDFTEYCIPTIKFSDLFLPKNSLQQLINFFKDHTRIEFKNVSSQEYKKSIDASGDKKIILHLYGPNGTGKKSIAEAIGHWMNIPLLIIDLQRISNKNEKDFHKTLNRVFREGRLVGAGIYLKNCDSIMHSEKDSRLKLKQLINAINETHCFTILSSQIHWNFNKFPFTMISFFCEPPGINRRKRIWEFLAFKNGGMEHLSIDELASKFKFTPGQIQDAFVTAQRFAYERNLKSENPNIKDFYKACKFHSNQIVSSLAAKIKPVFQWKDIVLPVDLKNLLKEVTGYVTHRNLVFQEWGFEKKIARARGVNILFSGPPGTGKTMAAEIMGNELDLDIYKIDLSMMVSKYIGETEKNIRMIFNDARTSNAILFFDEADALFGKRSEVRDSHDRYANIEVGYLLQKMEEHQGVVIMATNLRRNMDEAFTRRMNFVLDFPFPDQKHRQLIWCKIFPDETPKEETLDYEYLAKKFKLSGGNIKNIALHSAVLASQNSGKVNMKHIIQALRREYQKMGKQCDSEDLGEYIRYIQK